MNGKTEDKIEQPVIVENGIEDFSPKVNGNHEKKAVSSPIKKPQEICSELQGEEILKSSNTGFIVTVKDSYAFVESLDGEHEFFAHKSQYQDQNLQFGDHVVFDGAQFKGQWKALNVHKCEKSQVYEGELTKPFYGVVLRPMRMYSDNTEQDEYCGLIARVDQLKNSATQAANGETFEFSFISIKYEKDFIIEGSFVKFQVGTNPHTKKRRAFNVEVVRDKQKVSSLSLMFRFLSH